ncbi:MAG: Sec-independent protein translocase protein TatC [uncultured Sulfurimonas sp.]|nr:MAG: Sec-independent protein translocase protein TatC [uncultured Sulfurimonas sp.]
MFDEIRPHLVELRKRLAISAGSLIVMFFVMFYFHEPILTWMVEPLDTALIEVGKKSVHAADGMITTSQVGGAFFVAIKVAFFAAIMGALPIILSQIWMFIAPGLYVNEKKMIIPFVLGGTIMFATGVLFAYYVVTPFGFDFLITFGSFKFTPLINIEDYVGFFTKIMFGFGLAFQLPVFAYFLALLGLVDDKQMIAFFKYAIVIIFIVAALLTPPDILTQLLMAGPLIILYGLSIIIVKMVNPAEDEDDEEMNAEDKNEDGQIQTQDRLK